MNLCLQAASLAPGPAPNLPPPFAPTAPHTFFSHFFLAKRLNIFSFSFFAEVGSGRAAEEEEEVVVVVEEGGGRLRALAPEGPDSASSAL